MPKTFEPIKCGETLPVNNVHAVSVSMPTFKDVINYEEGEKETLLQISSGYPRFIMHPYLRLMANFLEKKYNISKEYELILLSSKKAVEIISNKYFIHNPCLFENDFKEDFGVILVQKETSQLQKVLTFIQHVGCNLSSRLAEDFLLKNGVIKKEHKEEKVLNQAKKSLLKDLSEAYKQPVDNICLAPSGMNAIYSVINGLKKVQNHNGRTILVQFGWLYLDTMNIVEHHYDESKTFLDITNLDLLQEYLKDRGFQVSAIITEVPTNPKVQCVDLKRLKKLCDKYNIPLIIDSTLATPYNVDLKPYADIIIESLTKYACGNADVLMGCFILNENSKLSHTKYEFFKYADTPYIKDIQRLAYEIKTYEQRMKKINANSLKLVEYLKKQSFVKRVYHAMQEDSKENYKELIFDETCVGGLISIDFNLPFQKVYDTLNFAKGPSLGTEFTLLMPYVYLAHYDYITCKEGQEFLKEHDLPIDLLRVSIGIEDINSIINEFNKLNSL